MKLTTHLHVLLRLRISGAIPLFPLYALVAWTGTTSFLKYLININVVCVVVNGDTRTASNLLASILGSVTELALVEDNGSGQRAIVGGKKQIVRHIKWSSDLWNAHTHCVLLKIL